MARAGEEKVGGERRFQREEQSSGAARWRGGLSWCTCCCFPQVYW